jgi:PadR family transcriptional regulator, regulatory protein PadR
MADDRSDVLHGTLDLMVLTTLDAMGPQHGFGIARRIEQVSREAVLLNQGTIYAALLRLEQRGRIRSEWGTSDNNRRAKFYALTASGRRELKREAANWHRVSSAMARLLKMSGQG